ncbi:MAG: translocation/assembly module TamB domain-containing protein [Silvibacterium sp.]|nr:translocation/assembly module TamB domain-containing protein [Silvibacterium sp.]
MSTAQNPVPSTSGSRRSVRTHWWKAVLLFLGSAALLLIGLIWYTGTQQFENRVRSEVVYVLESATGGRVELGSFYWRLLHLELEADNLTIHGLEGPDEAPYVHAQRVYVRAKFITFFRPKIGLNYLEIDRPAVHLIVYPDGSTNQPHPKVPSKSNEPITKTIFDLEVNRAVLNDGVALINARSIPFNLAVNNVATTITYQPAAPDHPERYDGSIHLEDISAQRGGASPVHSSLDLHAQLQRDAVNISSFRLVTGPDTLQGSASLQNFTNPQWKASLDGSVDARIAVALAPIPGLEKGIVQLRLTGQGNKNTFAVDGESTVKEAAYRTGTVYLQGVTARTSIHLTQDELTLANAQARLATGGTVEGSLRILNWAAGAPSVAEKPSASTKAGNPAQSGPQNTPNQQQGIIRARIDRMTIPSIMEVVAARKYRELGFSSVVSGPVTLDWTGSTDSFVLGARLALVAPPTPPPGEVPLNGTIDAQYVNPIGAVKIRTFTAQTPATQIQVTGALGVYPLSRASKIDATLSTTNLGEFDRTLTALGLSSNGQTGIKAIPVALHGQAAFQGTVTRSLLLPDVKGHLSATNFDLTYSSAAQQTSPQPVLTSLQAQPAAQPSTPVPLTHTLHWDSINADAEYAPELITVRQAALVHGPTTIQASGELHAHQVGRHHLAFDQDSALRLDAAVHDAAIGDVLQAAGEGFPVSGTLNAEMHVRGQINNLNGGGHLALQGGEAWGEPYRSLVSDLRFAGREISASNLVFLLDGGKIQGSGSYNPVSEGIRFSAQGANIDLAHLQHLKSTTYPIKGTVAFEAHGSGTVKDPELEANLHVIHLSLAEASTGYIDVAAHTVSGRLILGMNGKMTNASFQGQGQIQLSGDYPAEGHVTLLNLDVDPILQAFNIRRIKAHSSIAGNLQVAGPLTRPREMRGDALIEQLSLSLAGLPIRTEGQLHATLSNGRLHLDPFHVVGEDTDLRAQGSVGVLDGSRSLDLHGNGSINMKVAQTFDPDIASSGHVDFNVDATGTFSAPGLTGQVRVTNVNVALQDFPNGLSQMNGTLQFDQDRLDVKTLTAVSGGGKLQLGGFITYQQGLYVDLTATGKDVRIRYPQGVSSMADAKLHLQGTQSSMQLSGSVTITRFAISSDLDLASLSSSTSTVTLPPNPNAPSNRLRLDIHILSAPQLDFQNSYAKLAGDVDLRIRGTLAQPSLLGHIAITEGNATFAGTKYELQRGDIYFTNPVRIEPLIDLTATARVEDYDITIGLNGTPSKLNPTFRSEPPLSEQDIFSLLAMGRTQEEQQIYSMQQQQAGVNTTADALLGGALNATLSSRMQKLFGGGSVKIDPTFVSGVDNSTARITVEQHIAKDATLTYATNVNSTAQQFIQGQYNLTPTVSVLAVRDESGVFSLLVKIRRRYK